MLSHRSAAITFVLILALISIPADADDSGGMVEGVFTANGEKVDLPYVYIWLEEEGFYNEADPTWTLLFVENPIEERDLGGMVWNSAYIELGVTKTAGFSDEPASDEPEIQVYSQSIRFSADMGGNTSGGNYPTIELSEPVPGRFTGRVFHDDTQKIFDDTFLYDFTFSASLSDPNAPIGDPLPEGGGEPGAAYLAWCDAITSGDVEAIKALVPDEQAAMLDDPEMQAAFKDDLEFMQAMTPTDVVIVGGSTDGETAILEVTGKMEGEAVKGEITLIKHGDKWVNSGESWE